MVYRCILLLLGLHCVLAHSQQCIIHDQDVRTLRLCVDGEARDMPVIELNSRQEIEISFDDLRHDYRRFTYRIEHVAADFKTDEGLFDNEYMQADDEELPIEGYAQSMNTTMLYNHYSFTLPNADMQPLLSGNYRLLVNTENEDGDNYCVLEAYFAVVEQQVRIEMSASTDTEIDRNAAHQQLTVSVDCTGLPLRDASDDICLVVRQNGRYDNAVISPRPTSQWGQKLKWEHTRDLIFSAGNEYRRFEQRSVRYPGLGVDRVRWIEPCYYAQLFTDAPRRNYLYVEDLNGKYVIRAERDGASDTEADYMWVLFQLDMPVLFDDYDVYVDGIWTSHAFHPQYRMQYDPGKGTYELALQLKQGYYSYQYLAVPKGGGVGQTDLIEGDYYQTENRYDVFVYGRLPGERYDRLLGWRQASYNIRH